MVTSKLWAIFSGQECIKKLKTFLASFSISLINTRIGDSRFLIKVVSIKFLLVISMLFKT